MNAVATHSTVLQRFYCSLELTEKGLINESASVSSKEYMVCQAKWKAVANDFRIEMLKKRCERS